MRAIFPFYLPARGARGSQPWAEVSFRIPDLVAGSGVSQSRSPPPFLAWDGRS